MDGQRSDRQGGATPIAGAQATGWGDDPGATKAGQAEGVGHGHIDRRRAGTGIEKEPSDVSSIDGRADEGQAPSGRARRPRPRTHRGIVARGPVSPRIQKNVRARLIGRPYARDLHRVREPAAPPPERARYLAEASRGKAVDLEHGAVPGQRLESPGQEGARRADDAEALTPPFRSHTRVEDNRVSRVLDSIEQYRCHLVEPRSAEQGGGHPKLVKIREVQRLQDPRRTDVPTSHAVEGGRIWQRASDVEPRPPVRMALPRDGCAEAAHRPDAMRPHRDVPGACRVEMQRRSESGEKGRKVRGLGCLRLHGGKITLYIN